MLSGLANLCSSPSSIGQFGKGFFGISNTAAAAHCASALFRFRIRSPARFPGLTGGFCLRGLLCPDLITGSSDIRGIWNQSRLLSLSLSVFWAGWLSRLQFTVTLFREEWLLRKWRVWGQKRSHSSHVTRYSHAVCTYSRLYRRDPKVSRTT